MRDNKKEKRKESSHSDSKSNKSDLNDYMYSKTLNFESLKCSAIHLKNVSSFSHSRADRRQIIYSNRMTFFSQTSYSNDKFEFQEST
jgi:hypothetical protein